METFLGVAVNGSIDGVTGNGSIDGVTGIGNISRSSC